MTYSIVIYLLLAIFAYFKLFPAVRDNKERLFLILPFLIFPFLIWGLRRLLTWWYHRKIIRDEKKLQLLKERKVKILDEVMEKETYKVAKQILDKFAPSRLVTPPRPIGQPSLRYLGSFVQSQNMLAPLKLELNIVDKNFLLCAVDIVHCALCRAGTAGTELRRRPGAAPTGTPQVFRD